QIDLPPNTKSGLVEALRILDGVPGIVTVRFNEGDVVRHPLVAKDGVRVLSDGELKAKLSFDVAGASKAAIEKIEKAGGSVKLPEAAAAE
ncbi:uL15m family ribosomal protein, partial [Mesorhizobium sp. M1A.F.Ca.ET.072.01.1.1]|uniref:uL15m family ribosomal protein n=1 Tax=Mesorhizobium sp. M1A.F.Ca.ET.072.01.1.1 TaxID=2496753 RepID=UPI001FDF757B